MTDATDRSDPGDVNAPRAAGSCPWCGTQPAEGATTCPSCGAALAERESLGGLVLPGVTAVDPGLAAYDAQPWRIPKASPSQGMAGGTIAAAALGGPAGLAALAGLAAVGAAEYLAANRKDDGTPAFEDVGKPSEAAFQMLQRLDAEGAAAPGEDETPAPDQER